MKANRTSDINSNTRSLAATLKEALKDASRDDLCTIEGIDSATGKPFTMDFEDLVNGNDTIRAAVERCNKDH